VNLKVWRPRLPGPIYLLVLHFDGCRSSRQCYDVLVERGLSAHLMIDQDGTIYQALDLQTALPFESDQDRSRCLALATHARCGLRGWVGTKGAANGNTPQLLGMTDWKTGWRRKAGAPPALAKNAGRRKAASEYKVRQTRAW
jgi:N-acetylmuramoyl-L-alanine amidase.